MPHWLARWLLGLGQHLHREETAEPLPVSQVAGGAGEVLYVHICGVFQSLVMLLLGYLRNQCLVEACKDNMQEFVACAIPW